MSKKNANKTRAEKETAMPVVKAAEAQKVSEAPKAAEVTEKKRVAVQQPVAEKVAAPEKAAVSEKKSDLVTKGKEAAAKVVKAAKKVQEKKDAEVKVVLQYAEKEAEASELVERVKKAWVDAGHRAGNIKSLDLYVKPEEAMVYFVVNGKETGQVELF